MTNDERKAFSASLHGKGYNCCQSVLIACGEYTGLSEADAASLGYGFAGGMYCGEVCGAVTGGLMAIGKGCLPGDKPMETRPAAVRLSEEYEERFRGRFGSLCCRDILAAHGREICDTCIQFGAENAVDIIEKQRGRD